MPGEGLEADLRYCRGVGEKRAAFFAAQGLRTLGDLFRWHPFRYEDRRTAGRIADIRPPVEKPLTFFVSVFSKEIVPTRFRRKILRVTFTDGTGMLGASFFNPKQIAYFGKIFNKGVRLFLTGKPVWDSYGSGLKVANFDFEIVGDDEGEIENIHTNRIVPVYSEISGISPWFLRSLIYRELKNRTEDIADPLPQVVLREGKKLPLGRAYRAVHFPSSPEEAEEGRRRLAFDRFFYLGLHLQLKKRKIKAVRKSFRYGEEDLTRRLKEVLPFRLTPGQEKVWGEISRDLERSEPMNRLLQGDVGSGKTVVSLLAMLRAVGSGHQACLLAPTEILARQHLTTLNGFLKDLDLRAGLLTGGMKTKERQELLASLASGACRIVVGTHALLEEDVIFPGLSLVVIDEQHKFGVEQRLKLIAKAVGGVADLLVMTATPIPRTLSLTLYGDLDLSVIEGLPPGRKPVVTKWYPEKKAEELYAFVREAVGRGEKAYFIYPAVEESAEADYKAVTEMYGKFRSGVFKDLPVGLIHGRLKQAEKEDVMARFRSGEVKILVATTVVEVGVDVPDATIIVVENAERFGLAQLHQLRGRIGRGARQSWCLLLTSYALSAEGRQRMAALRSSQDGFHLAGEDLRIRGPGEFLGTRQSGLPDLFPADLSRDGALLEEARQAAEDLLAKKILLTDAERKRLWTAFQREVREKFEYVRAG